MPISIEGIKKQTNKLKLPKFKRRERVLAVFLILFVMMCLYYRKSHVPRAVRIRGLTQKLEKMHTDRISIEAQFPDLDAERENFNQLKEKYEQLKETLRGLEAQLWDRTRIPELLETVTAPLGEDSKMDLLWVKTKKRIAAKSKGAGKTAVQAQLEEDKSKNVDIYPKFNIEMSFYSGFGALIEYIKEMEELENYIKITKVQMTLTEVRPQTPKITLGLVTLLGEGVYTPEDEEEAKEVFADAGKALEEVEEKAAEEDRGPIDPFSPTGKPYKKAALAGFLVDGIMWKGDAPYAVINGLLYTIGEEVDGKTIVSIEEKEVVLQEADQRYHLRVQQ